MSIAFFTGPGVFSILVLYCWSIGSVMGRFHDGGLSAVFYSGTGEEVVGSFNCGGGITHEGFASSKGLLI